MARPGEMMGRPRPKLENPMGIFKRIMGYIFKSYKIHCIFVLIFIIVGVLSSLQGTLFMSDLIDVYIDPMVNGELATEVGFPMLMQAIIKVAIFYLIGVITGFAKEYIMIFITQGTLRDMRNELFEKMEKLPISYFDSHTHGDIMSTYTNDIDTMRQMISQSIPQVINSGFTIVSSLCAMIVLSIPLTVLTLVMVVVMTFATKFAAGRSGKNFVAQQKKLGAVNGYIEEMINGQKVVKVFCHEEEGKAQFKSLNDSLFESADKANAYVNILMPMNAQLGNLNYVLCAIVGGALAILVNPANFFAMTVGDLVSFLQLNKNFIMPINQVSQQFNAIVMALAGADRIFKLMDTTPETDEGYVTLVNAATDKDGNITECEKHTGKWAWKHVHQATGEVEYRTLTGDVVFDMVDFGYVPEKIVLHDIELHALPGQKIAFVGSTGAGKTTITNLINRFYDIQDGKIRYDGINVNKIVKADLRRSLGIVLQDTHLFTGTIAENIRFGKLDATDEEVIAAAKLANAHGFIKKLPDGYNTMLTGDGANLSQGQRQLLAIARAAIADPPVLILDEATSSIDTRTERIVQEGMDRLMSNRTTFVIAHRLSTVKNSDCIMVLEQGRIVERGTHDELIEAKGRYYTLYTGNQITE